MKLTRNSAVKKVMKLKRIDRVQAEKLVDESLRELERQLAKDKPSKVIVVRCADARR